MKNKTRLMKGGKMLASECVTDRNLNDYVGKIVRPIFESAIVEKQKKVNLSLLKWLH